MSFVNKFSPEAKVSHLFVIAIFITIFSATNVNAAFDTIYFYVNGDTTATSMVQGDEFGWGSNCEIGASIMYEIFYDANNNSQIDRSIDILLTAEQVTDGSLLHEETSIPDGQIFNGTFILSLPPGNYIVRALDLSTDSSLENLFSVSAMLSPPNQVSGTLNLPGITAPNPLLANIGVTAESETGDEGFFISITDNNGDYTINLGPSATGVEFYISPAETDGFIAPTYSSTVISGAVTNVDFTYLLPADSVWGIVKDYSGTPLPHESDISAYSMSSYKNATTKNSRYVIYFTEAEKGEWFLENDSRNAPFYTTELSLNFSHDTLGSFEHDLTLITADTAIYAVITEESSLPINNYRVDASSETLSTWTESVSGTGSDNIVRIPVSSLDNSGWFVNVATFDYEFPIPFGYFVQPEFYINVSPGDTVTFNLTTSIGCCIGFTGNIDDSFDDGSLASVDISDLVYLVDFMFKGGPIYVCEDEANVTGGVDGVDISELVYLVDFMFKGGPAPVFCP
ncbi:MAG: hypothetical protein DWP97_07455 [Calditrichaeota bacterium]|nr:MAG: hypothetical protein DWP97_07455 [Calditrichota bacterium]